MPDMDCIATESIEIFFVKVRLMQTVYSLRSFRATEITGEHKHTQFVVRNTWTDGQAYEVKRHSVSFNIIGTKHVQLHIQGKFSIYSRRELEVHYKIRVVYFMTLYRADHALKLQPVLQLDSLLYAVQFASTLP